MTANGIRIWVGTAVRYNRLMTSVTLPAQLEARSNVRPLNLVRDLPQVADLIETCFSSTMDGEGRRYVREMRMAGQSRSLLGLAKRMGDGVSLPLTGYVWEEGGRIIGNASVIPFRGREHRIHLIANVAVHPDFRRRGIGRALTVRALEHAWSHGAQAAWLSVRADNTAALRLYLGLGFVERARRTTWTAPDVRPDPGRLANVEIASRHPRFWEAQRAWLAAVYPDELAWHRRWNFTALRPGFWNWLSTLLLDFGVQQWAAVMDGTLKSVLAYLPNAHETVLFAAATADSDAQALTELLLHARRHLPHRPRLSLDFPQGQLDAAIAAAGFEAQRTLVWLRARPAT